jgi:hypothetical protein
MPMTIYVELAETIEHGGVDKATRWAQETLDDVVAGHRQVNAVSHPLGFLCLPIHRMADEGVCIHLWGPQWQPAALTTSPAHCHSWELLSAVLTGELHNQTVAVITDPESPTHQVFEVHSSPSGDEIRATGRLVRHRVHETTEHHAGDRYRLPAGVFHQTLVPDAGELVATVALGRTRMGAADLSLGGLDTADHQVRRRLYGEQDTVQAAVAALHAIRAEG